MALSDEEFNRDLQEILGDDASSDSSTGLHFGSTKKVKQQTGKRKNKKANVALPSWYSGGAAVDETDDKSDDNNDDDWFTSQPSQVKQTTTAQPSTLATRDGNVNTYDNDYLTQDSAKDIKDDKNQLITTDTDHDMVNPSDTFGDQDTLNETEEKNKFLNQFEKNYGSNVPYGKLCDELENSESLSISTKNQLREDGNNQTKDDNDWTIHDQLDDSISHTAQPRQPNLTLDSNKNQFIKPSMLSKVSLADTLDSTLHQTIKEDDDDIVDTLKFGTIDSAINTKAGAIRDLDAIKKVIEKAGLSGNDDEDVASADSADYSNSDKDFEPLAPKPTAPNTGILGSRAVPFIDRPSISDATVSDNKPDQECYHLQQSKIDTTTKDNFKTDQGAPGVGSQGVQDNFRKQQKAIDDDITESRGFDLQPSIQSQGVQDNLRKQEKAMDDDTTEPRGFDLQPSIQSQGVQKHFKNQEKAMDDDVTEARGFDLQPIDVESDNEQKSLHFHDENDDEPRGFDLQAIETDSDSTISVTKSASMERKLRAAKEKLKASHEKSKPKLSNYSSPSSNTPTLPGKNFIERNKINAKKRDPRTTQGNTPRKELRSTPVKKTPNRSDKNTPKGTSNIPVSRQNRDARLIAASVESFANYIQDVVGKTTKISASPQLNIESDSNVESMKWQNAWKEEKSKVEKLMEDIKMKETSWLQQKQEIELVMEKKVHDEKQENFILLAKIREYEEQLNARKRVAGGGGLEGSTNNELKLLEKDIRDQESLLKGYQTENERLYDELKLSRTRSKAIEKKMYAENEQLHLEIISLKNKIEALGIDPVQRPNPVILGAGKIAELESELKSSKQREFNLRKEVDSLQVIKEELEKHIDKLVGELNEYKSNVEEGKMITAENLSELKEKHEEELHGMRQKLTWYVENQKLLDQDSNEMKQQRLQIKELNQQMEDMKLAAAKEVQESELYTNQRHMYENQIKDLKRQVKEMDEIIKRRYPNSLSALIYAANASTNNDAVANDEVTPSHSAVYLENQLRKIEEELKEKETESERSIRSLQQINEAMKASKMILIIVIKYDDRVKDLETQLATATDRLSRLTGEYHQRSVHPYTRTQALEKELEGIKERHKQRDTQIIKDITTAVELLSSVTSLSGSTGVDKENNILTSNHDDINEDKPTKDHLEVVIKKLLDMTKLKIAEMKDIKNQSIRLKSTKIAKRKTTDTTKSPKKSIVITTENRKLPANSSQDDKSYNPRHLLESELTELSNEKAALENQIAKLKLEHENDIKLLHDQLLEEHSSHDRTRHDMQVQMDDLKNKHKEEFRIYTSQHSEINVSEKNAKIESQKLLIEELRRKLTDANKIAKTVDIYRQRENSLKNSISELKEELTLIKDISNPDLRHFSFLLSKVNQLERKYKERENELKSMINFSSSMSELDINEREEKWQRILLAKNEQINYFRQELDNMMEVITKLQAQRELIPLST